MLITQMSTTRAHERCSSSVVTLEDANQTMPAFNCVIIVHSLAWSSPQTKLRRIATTNNNVWLLLHRQGCQTEELKPWLLSSNDLSSLMFITENSCGGSPYCGATASQPTWVKHKLSSVFGALRAPRTLPHACRSLTSGAPLCLRPTSAALHRPCLEPEPPKLRSHRSRGDCVRH